MNETKLHLSILSQGDRVDVSPHHGLEWPNRLYRPDGTDEFLATTKDGRVLQAKEIRVQYGTLFSDAKVTVVFRE